MVLRLVFGRWQVAERFHNWSANPPGCQYYQMPHESVVCAYDPLGRLLATCENGGPLLAYDGDNVIRTQPQASAYYWTFVHGPGLDDPLLGRYTQTGTSGVTYYFVTDGAGTQIAVGHASGYDATDEPEYGTGGKWSGATHVETSYGQARMPSASQPGLVFFRNRFYDQRTGQWTQEDPLGAAGGVNLYQFNGNNPVSYADPFGLTPCWMINPALCKDNAVTRGVKTFASNFRQGFSSVASGGVTNFQDTGPGARTGGFLATVLFPMMAPATTRVGGAAAVGTRYMGPGEAAIVEQSGVIPATNAAGRARVVHYTTDGPIMSAAEAQSTYILPEVPTHLCRFRLCNVLDDVPPTGPVAPGATQRATSQPINGAGRPARLEP